MQNQNIWFTRLRVASVGLPIVLIILLTSSCAQKTTKFYQEIIPKKQSTTIALRKTNSHSLNITYLGCGSMILESDGDAIITDPFFSTQGLLKVLGKVKTKPEMYEAWKNRVRGIPKASVRAALVSHTHYDHVMDLPTLIHEHYFTQLDAVYGNEFLPQMLQSFANEGVKLQGLSQDVVYKPASNDQSYQWISVTPHIRFLPIETTHAPQTKNKLHMKGPLDVDYFKKHLVWPGDKVKTNKWTVGTSYAFLVDFIQNDTLRVYIQTSASQFPDGSPPPELKKKPVDLAILCYASGLNVDDYPSAILKDINPAKMMFVHWEDFFRKTKSDDDTKLVRKTNPRKFRKRIDELSKARDFFVMPKPGMKVIYTY